MLVAGALRRTVRACGVLALTAGVAACAARGLPAWTHLGPADEPCELGEDVVGGAVEPGARDLVVPPRKKAWEAAHGGEEAAKPFIKARLAGWPRTLVVDGSSLPRDDHAFVARLARDTWRGVQAFTDRESGLPVDNVRLGRTVDRAEAR